MSSMTAQEASPQSPQTATSRKALGWGLVAIIAAIAPFIPAWPAGEDMGSTNYMGLLAANQPWNLLLFMAAPVILAETVAITELVILFSRNPHHVALKLNRWAGIIGGFYFVGVFAYLVRHAVVPLTTSGGWRGPADLIAVGFYLAGIIPLLGLALVEIKAIGSTWSERDRLKIHATLVGVFLVVAHVAMIAGMLDPTVLGWEPTHIMDDGTSMPGMNH